MLRKDYTSHSIASLPNLGIGRFMELAAQKDVISLCVGEPDFVTPVHIRESAKRALDAGLTSYTASFGVMELRQAISEYLESRFHLSYNPEGEIIVTVGGSEALALAFWAFLDPGDELLLPAPAFMSYLPCALWTGAQVVSVPTTPERNFKVTVADLEKFVTDKSKMLLLNYPGNPTGQTFSEQELIELAKFANKHDLIVISDEIYAELCYKQEHISIAALPGMKDRTIVISGVSKAHAMTGWRLGYACTTPELMAPLFKLHQFLLMCAPSIAQYAAIDAFKHSQEAIKVMRDEYNKRRILITERFRQMGFEVVDPEGAFYLFPSIKKFGLNSEDFCMRLVNEHKVACTPGHVFGESGEGFIRCSYASSVENIKLACDRVQMFIDSLK
ncbi:MAG: pyridoxal phosphate-dependent aminotransferase [Bacillota bacterium]|jgi:aminotransferase